jgi:hypothetical protein
MRIVDVLLHQSCRCVFQREPGHDEQRCNGAS